LVGSTSNESDTVVEVQQTLKKNKQTTHSPPQRTQKTPKRKEASEQVLKEFKEVEEPKNEKLKKAMTPAETSTHFLQNSVVRGKVIKVDYFKEQGLGLFLDKLQV